MSSKSDSNLDTRKPGCLRILGAILVGPIAGFLAAVVVGFLYASVESIFIPPSKSGFLAFALWGAPPTISVMLLLLFGDILAGVVCGGLASIIARGRYLMVGVLAGLPMFLLTVAGSVLFWDATSVAYIVSAPIGLLSTVLTSLAIKSAVSRKGATETTPETTKVPKFEISWHRFLIGLVVWVAAAVGFYWLLFCDVGSLTSGEPIGDILLFVRGLPDFLKSLIGGALAFEVAERVLRHVPKPLPKTGLGLPPSDLIPEKGEVEKKEPLDSEWRDTTNVEEGFLKYLLSKGFKYEEITIGNLRGYKWGTGIVFRIVFVEAPDPEVIKTVVQAPRRFASPPMYVVSNSAPDQQLDLAQENKVLLYALDRRLRSGPRRLAPSFSDFERYMKGRGVEFKYAQGVHL